MLIIIPFWVLENKEAQNNRVAAFVTSYTEIRRHRIRE